MLLFLSIVLSMLLVLRALNIFESRLKPAPQRVIPKQQRNGEIVDIDYEKVDE
ncbi:MAG: hypothetical protein JWO58_1281 [Chitinophagaceae bacterium]|nr:hypothetical protein [Chitinophagaceae bacterium]